MNKREAVFLLKKIDSNLKRMENISAALSWDFETSMSPRGGDARSDQLAWISGQIHQEFSSSKMKDALDVLKNADNLTEEEKAMVRFYKKEYLQATALPKQLAEDLVRESNMCQTLWMEARKRNDFSIVSPALKELIRLTRESADLRKKDGQNTYDLLLDDYDTGYTAEEVSSLFEEMKSGITAVMKMTEGKPINDSFLYEDYSKQIKKEACLDVLKLMHFDFNRGKVGESAHPFTNSVGPDDIRITNRFSEKNILSSFFSSMHEGGHALYEMGASWGSLKGTCLANGASMGFHESQSRLWENLVGHNPAFWTYYYSQFQKKFSGLKNVSFSDFIKAVNKITASDIRVDADEVTYGLHIILRFNLERRLFDGTLDTDDLPQAWDKEFKELFGYTPATQKEGVLQDVHWYCGLFGYFPSYALGNLYNSQIWVALNKDLNVDELLKKGELEPIHKWLNDKIYSKGMVLPPEDLIKQVTGESLNASYFVRFIKEKYGRLYEYSK